MRGRAEHRRGNKGHAHPFCFTPIHPMRALLLTPLLIAALASAGSSQIIVNTGDDLQAIVAAALSGSVIEVQSNATFVGDLNLGTPAPKDLTIQAGVGFTPRIQGDFQAAVVIRYGGQMVRLEGLELTAVVTAPSTPRSVSFSGSDPTGIIDTVDIVDCTLLEELLISGTGSSTTNLNLLGSSLTGDLNLTGTGARTINVDVDQSTVTGEFRVTGTGGNHLTTSFRNSTLGGIYSSPISTNTIVATFADCTIKGGVTDGGKNLSTDLALRRCRIEGQVLGESSGLPSDHHMLLESCLILGDGTTASLTGAANTSFWGGSPANLNLVNCTITGFTTGVDFDANSVVQSGLIFANTSDISPGTPAVSVTGSLIGDGSLNGVNGNITGLIQVDTDYALLPCTLGLDAGDNLIPTLSQLDLYGNPRIWDDDGDGLAIVNVGAVERPGGVHAMVAVFNGSGVNPVALSSTNPIIGTMTVATIAMTPSTILTVLAVDVPSFAPFHIPAWNGEVLVAASSILTLDFAFGTHFVPVPFDCALVGALISAQGARVELNGTATATNLLNRLDYVLGF